MHQAEHHAQRGGLAGPVRTEESGDRARLDAEAEPVDREYLAAEPFGQLIDDDPPVSDLRHAPISAQDL